MKTEAEIKRMKEKAQEELLTTAFIKKEIEAAEDYIKRGQGHYPNYDTDGVILWLKEILRLRQREIDMNDNIQRLRGMLYQGNKNV